MRAGRASCRLLLDLAKLTQALPSGWSAVRSLRIRLEHPNLVVVVLWFAKVGVVVPRGEQRVGDVKRLLSRPSRSMFGCGTETVDGSIGWNGSLMSNCPVLPNQSSRTGSYCRTTRRCPWAVRCRHRARAPARLEGAVTVVVVGSHTALVPGASMNARRTLCSGSNRTSARRCWPEVDGLDHLLVRTSQTATSSPRHVGSMPAAHRAGDPNVVLIAVRRPASWRSRTCKSDRSRLIPFRPRTEVVDELAGAIVDLDDAARLGLLGAAPIIGANTLPCMAITPWGDVTTVGDQVLVHRAEGHR